MDMQVRYVFLTHLAVAWYGTRVYELPPAGSGHCRVMCVIDRYIARAIETAMQ